MKEKKAVCILKFNSEFRPEELYGNMVIKNINIKKAIYPVTFDFCMGRLIGEATNFKKKKDGLYCDINYNDEYSKYLNAYISCKYNEKETPELMGVSIGFNGQAQEELEGNLSRVRKIFEERGLWIPLDEIPKYTKYYRECEWDSEIPKATNFFLVRDHIYSRYDGFKNNINPLILKHPVNLQIINRSKNISKGSNSDITLDKLYSKIRKYTGDWSRHDECLELIRGVYNG